MEEEGKEIVVEQEEVDHSSYLNAPSLGEHSHILFSPRGRSFTSPHTGTSLHFYDYSHYSTAPFI